MLKKLALLVLSFFAVFIFPSPAFSQNEFSVDSTVEYLVFDGGKTQVTHDITLENNFSTLYATSYSLSLENIDSVNIRAYTAEGKNLSVSSVNSEDKTTIKVAFDDAVVGLGKKRHFFVSYENSDFAVRTGEVWEISVPRLSDDGTFRSYTAVLRIPPSLGNEAYISPRPYESLTDNGYKIYKFDKDSLIKTGVTAGFGEFQVFTYTLNYHLENPLPKNATTEIALPPDTAFQKVYIKSLNPAPQNITIDPDGNWIALYNLSARQRLDIVASGEVQIFSSERHFPKPAEENLQANLLPTEFWQSDDIEIMALANKYKTPRAIYDYVSTTLKYDYERVRPNIERLGAKGALLSPNNAICMEFTDLFIAISRAAGIPAREVNGYAYTENPEIQPLSLVADVLHSWPEYWDETRGAWIPIDPTWASTTGGINFFDKLDLRHFTFVIHGVDANKPYPPGSYKLGANPQKDVFVSFGKLTQNTQNYPSVSASFREGVPFFNSYLNLDVKNVGTSALYNLYPTVFFDRQEFNKDFIEVLPPFASYTNSINIPYSFLGKNTPDEIKVEVDGTVVFVPANKNSIIITSLLALFSVFTIIIVTVLWKRHHLTFPKLAAFIRFGKKGSQSTSEKQST